MDFIDFCAAGGPPPPRSVVSFLEGMDGGGLKTPVAAKQGNKRTRPRSTEKSRERAEKTRKQGLGLHLPVPDPFFTAVGRHQRKCVECEGAADCICEYCEVPMCAVKCFKVYHTKK